MRLQVRRWGNGLAVRLPKALVERLGLKEGDEIHAEAIETALAAAQGGEARRRRKQALADIANAGWTLPANWKFDRNEANAR